MCAKCECEKLKVNLQWAVLRLYDTELITSSRACELLDCKIQDFREMYKRYFDTDTVRHIPATRGYNGPT